MKNTDDARMLAHKRATDEQRRQRAIARTLQDTLRRLTPGTATPASVRAHVIERVYGLKP